MIINGKWYWMIYVYIDTLQTTREAQRIDLLSQPLWLTWTLYLTIYPTVVWIIVRVTTKDAILSRWFFIATFICAFIITMFYRAVCWFF